jgi:hypothetical protein
MTADGQNAVNGTKIRIYNGNATLSSDFTIGANVPNGGNQRMVLVGESNVVPTPDSVQNFQTNFDANAAAGAVCYIGLGDVGIDCFSWGGFTGNALLPSSAGTPQPGSLNTMAVRVRNITAGCATALDEPDDTNSSANDFGYVAGYSIRNNASPITETLCPPPVIPVTPAATPTPAKKKKCKKKKKRGAAAAKKCKKKKKN